jgi:hypothetical protein
VEAKRRLIVSDSQMTIQGQRAGTIPVLPDQSNFYSGNPESWKMAFSSGLDSVFNPISISMTNPTIYLQVTQLALAEQQRQYSLTVLSLEDNIRRLTTEMGELREEIRQLCRMRTFVVPLATLAPAPFHITRQIPVTIQGDGEDFTATFTEANISASGDTEADAIANFKEMLVTNFEMLEHRTEDELGPLPIRQWSIIKDAIKRS